MSQVSRLNQLYEASVAATNGTIELVAIADPAGQHLDVAIKELGRTVTNDDPALWLDLLAMARQLRWRLATEPFPASYDASRGDLIRSIQQTARRRKHASGAETQRILDDLLETSAGGDTDITPPVGELLMQALVEVGPENCVVVLAAPRAAEGVRMWFRELGVEALVVSGRLLAALDVWEQAYLMGVPPLFGPSALTAPRARAVSYLFPSWVRDRNLPLTRFSDHAEGGIRVRARLHRVGPEPTFFPFVQEIDDPLVPRPVWTSSPVAREPGDDEVLARRVLLGGGLAIMLDRDGEHIRTLDPQQPAGERVEFREVSAVGPGTYLVLREGETESAALYARALGLLGEKAEAVTSSQETWKQALRNRLRLRGRSAVAGDLRRLGVRAASRAPAWTSPTVARPQAEPDFDLLLRWLGLPSAEFRAHANQLRRARSQAMADVRESLEDALSIADMDKLAHEGFLRLVLDLEGFAGIIAAQVLAISPYEEPVPRHEVRIPMRDRSAQWLA